MTSSPTPAVLPDARARTNAVAELQALAALIRRPPVDDVQLDRSLALRIAEAIDIAVTAQPVNAGAPSAGEVLAAVIGWHKPLTNDIMARITVTQCLEAMHQYAVLVAYRANTLRSSTNVQEVAPSTDDVRNAVHRLTDLARLEAEPPAVTKAMIWAYLHGQRDAQVSIAIAQAEIERLRGLLVDPGSPTWEDARRVLVAELRKAGFDKRAERVAEAQPELIPSDITLNLIAQATTPPASDAAVPAGELPEVMPGHWSTTGGRDMALATLDDPHMARSRERISDFALANEVFLSPGIGNLTDAKERIRWLSAQLAVALAAAPKVASIPEAAHRLAARMGAEFVPNDPPAPKVASDNGAGLREAGRMAQRGADNVFHELNRDPSWRPTRADYTTLGCLLHNIAGTTGIRKATPTDATDGAAGGGEDKVTDAHLNATTPGGEDYDPNAVVGKVQIAPEHNEALFNALISSTTPGGDLLEQAITIVNEEGPQNPESDWTDYARARASMRDNILKRLRALKPAGDGGEA